MNLLYQPVAHVVISPVFFVRTRHPLSCLTHPPTSSQHKTPAMAGTQLTAHSTSRRCRYTRLPTVIMLMGHLRQPLHTCNTSPRTWLIHRSREFWMPYAAGDRSHGSSYGSSW